MLVVVLLSDPRRMNLSKREAPESGGEAKVV